MSEVKVHRGYGGIITEGSKCKHSHTATPKSRARAQQSVSSRGQWNVTCIVGSIRRETHGALPRYTANSEHTIQRNIHTVNSAGRGCKFRESSRRKHTELAVLSWILQPSKFATPSTLTPPPCEPREQGQAPSIGAMDEMSHKVQNASTHPLGRKHHEHAHSSWSVQGGDG